MQLAGLDLNLLIVLDALLDERSVTRAGERIELSQSATSAALSRLRRFFGDQLLVPLGKGMMLTPQALAIQPKVRDIILRADAIAKSRTAFSPRTAARHFRLMMSDYPATVLMPYALARAQAVAPGVTFEILPLSESTFEDLDRGSADLLIMPQQWISNVHPAEPLFEDWYVCVVWSENRAVKSRLTREQYLESGHVAVRFPGQPFPVMEEWLFEQLGQRRRIEVTATSFTLTAHLVVGTERVATMHWLMARRCIEGGMPLRMVEPPIRMPRITECMQWHRHFESDAGISWLKKLLHSAVPRTAGRKQRKAAHR